jgi:hypothetical protein
MTILTRVELAGRSLARKYFFPRKPAPALNYDPYDKEACERKANTLVDRIYSESSKGAPETCQRILALIEDSYPTKELSTEYFSNLEIFLSSKPRLESPGQLVIGLGPGRCGSTSLAAMLGTVANSCSTHETPPLIFWNPLNEQIDFHIQRFRILTNYYSLVVDVSHWWLNSIERVFDHFPNAKVIGLIRAYDECAASFLRIQGFGKGSYNPWVARGSRIWRTGPWDPTYPTYAPPGYANENPDLAKLELITRYVKEYNARLEEMARNQPNRVKLVRTEELSSATVQEQIFQIAKAHGRVSAWKLNKKSVADGKKIQIKF